MLKKLTAAVLSVVLVFSLTATALAQSTPDQTVSAKRISFRQLPADLQQVIDPDAVIYLNDDGTFDIFQDNPVGLSAQEHTRADNASIAATQLYAPEGGSYSDLENGRITSITWVVYQTYLPRDNVDIWLCDQIPGLLAYILEGVASYTVEEIIARVALKYGINLSAGAVTAVIMGSVFVLDWLNQTQVRNASNSGLNGILIEYLTTIGAGNAKVYSTWSSEPYVPYAPYGGSATWHDADYWVMP